MRLVHPCACTGCNGGQCYNCLNGLHAACYARGRCGKKNDTALGLLIVVKSSKARAAIRMAKGEK